MLLYSLVCISLLREAYTRDGRELGRFVCNLVSFIASTLTAVLMFMNTQNELIKRTTVSGVDVYFTHMYIDDD